MKISTNVTNASNVRAIDSKRKPQVVKSKDAIGAMLIVGLGPGTRPAA
jgi:hypothetical protein